ncbi:MAG: Crp/Fnr family transcriptional regulator [Pseudomonadota bacterium]
MTALVTMPAVARSRRKGRPDVAGDTERLEAALLQACRPAVLSAEGAHALAGEAVECRVRAGDAVFSRDDAATDLWLVLEGRVALGARDGSGELQQRRCVEAGGWLDLASALLHGAHLEDAEAQTDARLCQLPLHAVLRCARVQPCVMPALATAMAGELAVLVDATRGLMTKDVLARCATWLLDHARLDPPNGERRTGTVQLQQRKRAVAQELGTTAETFSRTLGHLSRTGLIGVHGYSINLLDVQALERLARRA